MRNLTILVSLAIILVTGLNPAWAQEDPKFHAKYAELMSTKSAAAQENLYTQLKKSFPGKESELRQSKYKYMLSNIAASWLKEGNLQKYKQFKEKIGEFNITDVLVNLALQSMLEEGKYINLASEVAKSYLDKYSKQKNEGSNDYNINLHTGYLEIYAMIQHTIGNGEQAMRYMADAAALISRTTPQFATQYAKLLTTYGKHSEALNVLSSTIEKDSYDKEVINALENAYIKVYNGPEGYDRYLKSLKDVAYQFTIQEVKKMRKTPKPAPKWTLLDLDGKLVSLDSLKGKIVIMDFWATWCGPCKASFPAMQNAVDAFKNDLDVKFVFVSVDVEKDKYKVKKYIEETGYTFHVLLSPSPALSKQYGINGIPAKFVIDPEGNIQFNEVGSAGSPESTVNHIRAMIELIKADTVKKTG